MANRPSVIDLSEKHYSPKDVEAAMYRYWEEAGVCRRGLARKGVNRGHFSIVIPPPNVTGRLHMGHALNNSVQDALIRFKRMQGFDALWVPGTDHAGISTQSVVKKHLEAEGINYQELGREKMVERIWQWREKYGDTILNQLRRLGASCDWSMTRFTMDEGLSRAVREVFKRLYDEGLIYRGKYIVNWCPVDQTALSDDEVETKEGGEPGFLWHLRYPVTGSEGEFVTIATTRPETMLGDSAVAVNPKDERYQHLIGKTVTLPIVGREIPVIADEYVDRAFGTGCLKVTPAHDVNDFQIGLRHDLPQINVMNADGTMGDQAPLRFHSIDRFMAREVIVEELKAAGLLEKIEERMTPVGRAQRSKAVIEYRLSDQWFVKMKPLAENALRFSDSGDLKLSPERWEKVYRGWLENTRDWCISRQIWWGHRIPAWYNKTTGEILVDVQTPEAVQQNPELWSQDEDVLDTWFSSALWPFSTLGWPEHTPELHRYYPTSVLSTAKDIIYFWVARMVMMGTHFLGQVPFNRVYFHPVICDDKGETMSKSRGNGIDPLHVIDGASTEDLEGPLREARPSNMQEMLERLRKQYPEGFNGVGADALRFTLLSLNSESQQVQISLTKFEEIGQRFIDKLWNASRFILSSLDSVPGESFSALVSGQSLGELQFEDRWILQRLNSVTGNVTDSIDNFRFSEAAQNLYRFFWDDYCDWYIELVKPRLKSVDAVQAAIAATTACRVLEQFIRLLHPFTPYITEALWGPVRELGIKMGIYGSELPEEVCAQAEYPESSAFNDVQLEKDFAVVQDIVREVRNMRSNANVPPSTQLAVSLLPRGFEIEGTLAQASAVLTTAARLLSLNIVKAAPEGFARVVLPDVEIYVNLKEHIDVEAEIRRNKSALEKAVKDIEKFEAKLNNPAFIGKAPDDIVAKQREGLEEAQARKAKIEATLVELGQ
ncbi:MAG: valine--tRNA ligase [bacterium]|nr:valine--tRNA ligase [bacterium]